MYKFEVNTKKNRLYVTHSGVVEIDDPEKYLAEYQECLNQLKPGFDVVSNILELQLMDDEAIDWVQQVMKLSKEGGLRNVVRVIPNSVSGEAKAYSFEKKAATVGYISNIVYSLEDADKLLDKLEQENK